MLRTIYVDGVAAFLLASALAHFFAPAQTSLWLGKPRVVRGVGALLLISAVPCVGWGGWYFWALFAGLAFSGAWRFFFPRHSIRAQEKSYPRWAHGCLLLGGCVLVLALQP